MGIRSAQNEQKKSRRRSTLPRSHPRSTIAAKELNFRVRDGIGCGLFANITGKIVESSDRFQAIWCLSLLFQRGGEASSRTTISTGLLNALPHVHSLPIDLIVFKVSS